VQAFASVVAHIMMRVQIGRVVVGGTFDAAMHDVA